MVFATQNPYSGCKNVVNKPERYAKYIDNILIIIHNIGMGYRSFYKEELIKYFNIPEKKIDEYYNNLSNLLFSRLSSNYPSCIVRLLQKYQMGFDKLICEIRRLEEELGKKINKYKLIHESYNTKDDIEIAKIIFGENNKNYTNQIKYISIERCLRRIREKIEREKEYYDTDYYEGIVILYGNIYFDADALFNKNSRRTQQSANMDIFRLSNSLLYYYVDRNTALIPTTIFLIRQAIEIKILETFGIKGYKCINDSDHIPKINISKLLRFCKKLCENRIMDFPVDISLVVNINTWCNSYIHTGDFIANFWEIEWLHFIMRPLFFGDINTGYLSRSIKIKKEYFEKNFYTELEKELSNKKHKIEIIKKNDKFIQM
jgi:hypothetical protein